MSKPILSLSKVNVSQNNRIVLSDITLDIYPKDIVGIIGNNGSGKTTMLKTILGLVDISSGEIRYRGNIIDLPKDYSDISYVADDGKFYPFWSATTNLLFFLNSNADKETRKKIVREILCKVGLSDNAEEKVHQYSLGMRQRLNIARGLASKPKILLMDEPLNGLDPTGVDILKKGIVSVSLKTVH